MDELAGQLSNCKLEIDILKEQVKQGLPALTSTWMGDGEVNNCTSCGKDFSLARRKVLQQFIQCKTRVKLARKIRIQGTLKVATPIALLPSPPFQIGVFI